MTSVLIEQLKLQIIEQLNLEDINPNDIDPNDHLFEGSLGLDSIDALELIVLLDREYDVKITSRERGHEILSTVTSIAAYIEEQQANSQ